MIADTNKYNILVIEDNPGDYALVEDFLFEQIELPIVVRANDYAEAKKTLLAAPSKFDIILLDLSLPDKTGKALIEDIIEIASEAPVIVLTGYANFEFGVSSISLGAADYILKDELTALALYKSIIYSLQRKKSVSELQESEKKYSELFHLSPLPMWVVNLETLKFLDVNSSTINHYGYSREEFLSMTLKDIRPDGEIPNLLKAVEESRERGAETSQHVMIHQTKNGTLRHVELKIAPILYNGQNANVVLANDITDRINYIKAIETQNKKLTEISWLQSHVIRAPLARIMGLIQLVDSLKEDQEDRDRILEYILSSANELDDVITNISDKTKIVDF